MMSRSYLDNQLGIGLLIMIKFTQFNEIINQVAKCNTNPGD